MILHNFRFYLNEYADEIHIDHRFFMPDTVRDLVAAVMPGLHGSDDVTQKLASDWLFELAHHVLWGMVVGWGGYLDT